MKTTVSLRAGRGVAPALIAAGYTVVSATLCGFGKQDAFPSRSGTKAKEMQRFPINHFPIFPLPRSSI